MCDCITFSGMVSSCVVLQDISDEQQLLLDVLRGLLPTSSHILRVRGAIVACFSLRHWLG